jgi:hypothetical protein
MIRNIPGLPGSYAPGDYHGGKIKAYYDAYGNRYDFCRLYEYDSGYALIFNANMVISGDASEELTDFIAMTAPHTVESPFCIKLNGYGEENVTRFTGRFDDLSANGCKTELCADDIRQIFTQSFEDTDFISFYSDLSHRVRHGVSKAFLYNSSFAVCDFTAGGTKYLSCLCTLPGKRRNGDMKRLLSCISRGDEISVTARENTADIYRNMGFSEQDTHELYIMT